MKNIFFALILFAVPISAFMPSKDTNKIYWSNDVQLRWTDFKGSPKHIEGIEAFTTTGIDPKVENSKLGIYCYFEKNTSWRIKKSETEYLLKHEQYHFNITELFARKLRKQIRESNLSKKGNELQKVINKNALEWAKFEVLYDKETKHSKNTEAQAKWISDIDNQLKELSDFTDPIVE
jgi:hypothetical protein